MVTLDSQGLERKSSSMSEGDKEVNGVSEKEEVRKTQRKRKEDRQGEKESERELEGERK